MATAVGLSPPGRPTHNIDNNRQQTNIVGGNHKGEKTQTLINNTPSPPSQTVKIVQPPVQTKVQPAFRKYEKTKLP